MPGPVKVYEIQPAFSGGEISQDVSSRVDLDKYRISLLQAENAVIRPYGAVRKRTGLIYCGQTKYSEKKSILVRFDYSVTQSYLLEIGDKYIRIWRDGVYLNVELVTPYSEAELEKLRFVQSIDVMYITSGSHPVMKVLRYADTNWQIKEVDWTQQPFNDLNPDETLTITPSATSETVTLTASKAMFTADNVGDWMKLEQIISGSTVTSTGGASAALMVGDTWKIITHGTWTGNVVIEKSIDDGATWTQERKYTSAGDFNPSESGTVENYCLMRVVVTGSGCTADLSAYPYTHEGVVKITAVTDSKHATAEVIKTLGNTNATYDWYWGAWSKTNGYPNCATFFQDRLCFGGSKTKPQRVWMSCTGDYENFAVDKEAGTVTDDSSITADLLSLKAYTISHMDAGTDLVILTEGNEWTISGAETVTPSKMTPRNQQNYGVNGVNPLRVGNRIIYVQRRGSIIRDTGYNYQSDSYVGADLTLLARHIVEGYSIKSSAYAQEPDSIAYFVRSDGTLLCLTYVIDQKVYAWSRIKTDGEIEAVSTAASGNNDVVYIVVKREIEGETVRYIESFSPNKTTAAQQDYIMLDSAVVQHKEEASDTITGLDHLEGKEILVMADGYLYDPVTVKNGTVTIPDAVKDITAGLPYTAIIEQPNFDVQLQDGTIQGREKAVNSCKLRLLNSYGGEIGPDKDHLAPIRYTDAMELGQNLLYTGDKDATLAQGGFNKDGRVYIKHDTPYPFCLSAIIRTVTFGG